MISSFSQEQFQQFYEFSGGGGGGNNKKVPKHVLLFMLNNAHINDDLRPEHHLRKGDRTCTVRTISRHLLSVCHVCILCS